MNIHNETGLIDHWAVLQKGGRTSWSQLSSFLPLWSDAVCLVTGSWRTFSLAFLVFGSLSEGTIRFPFVSHHLAGWPGFILIEWTEACKVSWDISLVHCILFFKRSQKASLDPRSSKSIQIFRWENMKSHIRDMSDYRERKHFTRFPNNMTFHVIKYLGQFLDLTKYFEVSGY
jgi:hypothetical protein